MTTITWTNFSPATTPVNLGKHVVPVLKSVRHFLAVCIGVYAEQDSNYRGLDLYGKPIWVNPPKH